MATFEIKGQDGAIYDVEAPSAEAAVAAFKKMQSGAQQGKGTWQTIKENVFGEGDIDTPGERIGAAIKRGTDAAYGGLARGGAALMDLPGSIISSAGDMAARGIEAAGANPTFAEGVRSSMSGGPWGAGDTARNVGHGALGDIFTNRGETRAERLIGSAAEFAPSALFGGGLIPAMVAGVGSELAGEAASGRKVPEGVPLIGGANIEPAARIAGAMIGGAGAQKASDAMRQRSVRNDYVKAAPEADTLRQQAGDLYRQAEARGVVAQPKQFQIYKGTLENLAKNKGFITSQGNYLKSNETSSLVAALKALDDYAAGPVTVQDFQGIRSQLQIIAESNVPKVSAMGVQMLKAHDKFLDRLAPELKTANALYTRAKRGDMMETVGELADVKASQLTQSGMENALRSEFRALDRQIIRGKVPGLRDDQRQAVQSVSRGTTASNTARAIGRAAPTGAVSAGLAGGVPFMIGNAIGGPQVGSILSAAVMGVGGAGRAVATSLQQRAAEYASAAMRSGVPMEQIESNVRAMLLGATTQAVADPAR